MSSNKQFESQSLVLSTRSGRKYGRGEYYVKIGPKTWKTEKCLKTEVTLNSEVKAKEVNRKRPLDASIGVSLKKVGKRVSLADPNLEDESPDDYPEKSYRVAESKENHNIVLVRSTTTDDICSEHFYSKILLATNPNGCHLNTKSTPAIVNPVKKPIRVNLSGDGPIAQVIAASLRKPSNAADKPHKPIEGFGLCPYCKENLQETEPLQLGRFRIVRPACQHHCIFCTFWHKHPQGLLEHKQNIHTFRCEPCKVIFPTRDESVVHFHEKHQPFHECLPCRRFFPDLRAFSGHTKSPSHLDRVDAMRRTWDMIRRKFGLPSTEKYAEMSRFKHAKKVPQVLKEGRYSGHGIISHDSAFLTRMMSKSDYEWIRPIEASTPNQSLTDGKNQQPSTDGPHHVGQEGAHGAMDLLANFSPNSRRMAHQIICPEVEEMEVNNNKETDQIDLLPTMDSEVANDYLSQLDHLAQSESATVQETVPPPTFSLDRLDPFLQAVLEQNLISVADLPICSSPFDDYQPSGSVNDDIYTMLSL